MLTADFPFSLLTNYSKMNRIPNEPQAASMYKSKQKEVIKRAVANKEWVAAR
jgi:hypothetical protein